MECCERFFNQLKEMGKPPYCKITYGSKSNKRGYSMKIEYFDTFEEVIDAFRCPGPCNPDCPLNVYHNYEYDGEHGEKVYNMCSPEFWQGNPERMDRVLKAIGARRTSEVEVVIRDRPRPNDKEVARIAATFRELEEEG